jgi:leucine-rich repeat transmembrane neuronal protein 1/2
MAVKMTLTVLQWCLILCLNVLTLYAFELGGSSHSFSKFESWVPCQNGTITFQFKTLSGSGILMYIDGGGRKSSDYFELKLINGAMHLTYNINNELNMLSAGQNLNDNEWHSVNLIRDGRLTTLKVDAYIYTRQTQNYDPNYVTFENSNANYVFIGGLPSEYKHKLSDIARVPAVYEPRLQGSVRNIFYSNCGKAMTSPQMLDSEGLVMEGDQCMKNNPCKNEGICVMLDDGVQCDCIWTNFDGKYCEIGKLFIVLYCHGKKYIFCQLVKSFFN